MKVGFLGLGAMGYPMAGHVAGAFETVVWNRTTAVAERHAKEYGAVAVADAADAAGLDAVVSCVPTSAVVDQLVDRCLDSLRAGALWIDCTSGHPDEARATARRLAERGVAYLDAPVSGGVPRARTGELAVMAGGDPATLETARPVLDAFAATIVLVGGTGAGHAVKAINNMMMAINVWGAAEGLLALERQGIHVPTALSVINASSGRSNASENLLPKPLATGEYPLNFKLSLLYKDAGIAQQVIRGAGCPGPLSALASELLATARGCLSPDADYLEVARALRAWQVDGNGG